MSSINSRISQVRSADLAVNDPELKKQLMSAVDRVLSHGMMLMGHEVEAFEKRFAESCGMPYCVAVSSGSSAVYLSLKAIGIGVGDEVITTPMSWIATLNAIRSCGATPIFADVGHDLNINPQQVEAVITEKTKAILLVHYTGRLCDMGPLLEIAKRHDISIVEDASQSFGASMNGKFAGGFGETAGFSLNPMKVLHGYGELGAVCVRTEEARNRLESLRYCGTINKETCIEIELNHKPDAIQSAMMMVSMDWFGQWEKQRHINALRYVEGLTGVVELPEVPKIADGRSVFFDFTIMVDRRDELLDYLIAAGIEAKVKHRTLMCDQPAHKDLPYTELPVARRLVDRILTLPMHEKLTEAQIDYVCQIVKDFYK
jgi:dTDP-4-amino-4,6-dideoxygalactose transaminase